MANKWIIQLRPPEYRERYYAARGHYIGYKQSEAKIFLSQKEAEAKRLECSLYEETSKLIEV